MSTSPVADISPELKKCFAFMGFACLVAEPVDLPGAETFWSGLVELLDTDLDLPLVELGCIRLQQKRFAEATSFLERALKHNPESSRAMSYLIVALELGGHAEEAEAYRKRFREGTNAES